MHLDNDYIDGVSHPEADRTPALIDPHGDLLILLAATTAILICRVLIEAELMQVEALLELVLTELVAVSANLHDVFE
jgi:hypothetical protein